MTEKPLNCLVLAAGLSRRAGCNKLLQPIQGKPLYRFILEKISQLTVEGYLAGGTVVVVTNYPEIEQTALTLGFLVVPSPQAAAGKSYSLRAGLRALEDRAADTICLVADQPFVSLQTLKHLIANFREAQRELITYPQYAGKRGNPVIFPQSTLVKLQHLSGDEGGAKIIADLPALAVAIDDITEAKDFDLPEDFY